MAKKLIGIVLVLAGLAALVTPFTPGSWLIFIGLEFLGFRLLFKEKFKQWGWRPAKKADDEKTPTDEKIF